MKVIGTSNFADESVADVLVEEDLSDREAEDMADAMNAKEGNDSHYYYQAVEDNARLWRGMEELV